MRTRMSGNNNSSSPPVIISLKQLNYSSRPKRGLYFTFDIFVRTLIKVFTKVESALWYPSLQTRNLFLNFGAFTYLPLPIPDPQFVAQLTVPCGHIRGHSTSYLLEATSTTHACSTFQF